MRFLFYSILLKRWHITHPADGTLVPFLHHTFKDFFIKDFLTRVSEFIHYTVSHPRGNKVY